MVAEFGMPPFARVFRLILFGAIFMILDIRLDGLDLLPDVVGHVLMGIGCMAGLPHLGDMQAVGRASVWILLGATVLALAGDLLELVDPAAARDVEGLMSARSSFALIAFTVLGRAVASTWLPRHARRWQVSLVALLILTALRLFGWLAGHAVPGGWESLHLGLVGAPIALLSVVVALVWFCSTLYAVFSTLPALKRVRSDAPRPMMPAA